MSRLMNGQTYCGGCGYWSKLLGGYGLYALWDSSGPHYVGVCKSIDSEHRHDVVADLHDPCDWYSRANRSGKESE